MQESSSFSPNSLIASADERNMLKPYLILLCISPCMKSVIYGVQVDECGPLEMALSRAWRDHGLTVCVGMPSST